MTHRAADPAVPDVTVILTAHQNEQFVAEAVHSILAQVDVVVDAILSDDSSTDRTFDVMTEVARNHSGPHQVRLRRSPHNRGPDHGLELVDLARSDVIVMAHGDDISEPNRCRRLLDEMRASSAYAATSNYLEIDEAGWPAGLHLLTGASRLLPAEEIARTGWQPALVGSTLAFRRDVVTSFPQLEAGCLSIGHDTLLPFRAAVLGGMRYIHEPLVRRRRHNGQSGMVVHDTSSPEAFRESHASANVMFQASMARDLRHLSLTASPADQPRLAALERVVNDQLLVLADNWLDVRQALYRQRLRPMWVNGEEFSQLNRRHNRPRLRETARRLYRRWRWQLLQR